jgi:hypothetical protein
LGCQPRPIQVVRIQPEEPANPAKNAPNSDVSSVFGEEIPQQVGGRRDTSHYLLGQQPFFQKSYENDIPGRKQGLLGHFGDPGPKPIWPVNNLSRPMARPMAQRGQKGVISRLV